MNIDPEFWNAMTMDEKRDYAERFVEIQETPEEVAEVNDSWKVVAACACPVFLGAAFLASSFSNFH